MQIIFPNQGLVEQIKRILNGTVNYHLFTNNVTPTRATVLTDLTEAIWAGYSPFTLTFTDFTLSGVAGNNGYAIAAPINFGNSSGSDQSAYGYYVTDGSNTMLLAVALFDSPPVTVHNGDSIPVVPTWGDTSQLP